VSWLSEIKQAMTQTENASPVSKYKYEKFTVLLQCPDEFDMHLATPCFAKNRYNTKLTTYFEFPSIVSLQFIHLLRTTLNHISKFF